MALKLLSAGVVILGWFDALWCFVLGVTALITQFSLILYLPLALLYFIGGVGIIFFKNWGRRTLLFGLIPLSLSAAWNVTLMGSKDMPDYFYTPPNAQATIILYTLVLPLFLNMIFLILPAVRQRFQQAKQK